MDEFESNITKAFDNLDVLKKASCLDITTIGLFAENKLSDKEKYQAESHIQSCLYCLSQLTELQELLYIEAEAKPVSSDLEVKLNNLFSHGKPNLSKKNDKTRFFRKIGEALSLPFLQWRYSVVSLVSVCITIIVGLTLLKQNNTPFVQPNVNLNSFVNIKALGGNGNVLSEAQGVVVSAKGLIASNLNPLIGATSVQVTLRDGSTYNTRNVWKDEDNNLAVMKIDKDTIAAIPLADIKEVSIGEQAFVFVDPDHPKKGFTAALVSDFKTSPGRFKGEELQYIQLATITSTATRGALVDKNGKLIGFLLTQEKNINLAVPMQDIAKMVTDNQAVPVSELKNTKFSAEALNYYMQGILARDALKWDPAIELFKKALALNPDLQGAHLELGYLYDRKRLYEEEAKEYQEALRINPNNTDAIFFLAENLETRGFYKQAIELYKKIIRIDPEDADTYYNLGLAYIAEGRINEAMEIYPRLKTLNPGSADMLKRLAKKK